MAEEEAAADDSDDEDFDLAQMVEQVPLRDDREGGRRERGVMDALRFCFRGGVECLAMSS